MELRPGQKAPAHGLWISPELGAYYHTAATGADRRLKLELSKTASIAAADRQRDLRVHAAELKTARAEGFTDGYKKGFEEAAPAWYETPPAIATWVGVLAIGACIAIFFAAKEIDHVTDRNAL